MEKQTSKNKVEKDKISELGLIQNKICTFTYHKLNYFTSPDEIHSNIESITTKTERLEGIEHSMIIFFFGEANENNSYKEPSNKTNTDNVLANVKNMENTTEKYDENTENKKTIPKEKNGSLVKNFLAHPMKYRIDIKLVKNMVNENPGKVAKQIYNNFTHRNLITEGIIKTYEPAIQKIKETPKIIKVQPNKRFEDMSNYNCERSNKILLTITRKKLRNEYKKLKGLQNKIPKNVNCNKGIYKLSKDLINRLQSNNPRDFLMAANSEINFNQQPPAIKEQFWNDNFLHNNLPVEKIKIKDFNVDYEISPIEIKVAIKMMKTNKAPDVYKIRNEFINIRSNDMYNGMAKIFNTVIKSEQIFEREMREIKLVGIPKGKDSFRPICITSCTKSLFDSVVLLKLTTWMEENHIMQLNQIGFLRNQNIYDHIEVAKERIRSSNNNFIMAFIDLKKAYNSVERQILYAKLKLYYEIDDTLLAMIQMSIEGNLIYLNNNRRIIERGLPQGNRLSPILFNLFFNDLIIEYPEYLHNNIYMYADDLTLVTHHPSLMNSMLETLESYCTKNYIEINIDKSKILASNNFKEYEVKIKGQNLQQVDNFKYLGLSLNNKGINTRQNLNDCNRIITLKSIFLRNYLKANNIKNIGIIVTLAKMFILSNINFYWILNLENNLSGAKLNIMIKKVFKILFYLNRRFPSETLEAIMMLGDYKHQIFKIATKFKNRVSNHKESMIKDLLEKNKNKAISKLVKILEEKHESKLINIKRKQLESFGIELYDKIPFSETKSRNIRSLIQATNIESRKIYIEEIEEENEICEEESSWWGDEKSAKRVRRK